MDIYAAFLASQKPKNRWANEDDFYTATDLDLRAAANKVLRWLTGAALVAGLLLYAAPNAANPSRVLDVNAFPERLTVH